MATIPTNYTELQAAIASDLLRDDQTTNIPMFIRAAEDKFNTLTNFLRQEKTAAVSTTIGQVYTNLPTGFVDNLSLTFDSNQYCNPVKVDIMSIDDNLDNFYSSVPRYYAISDDKYWWDVKPDAVYNLTARYYKKWDIATDVTNALLTNYPSAYLYAALAEGGKYLRHPRTEQWKADAGEIINAIQYRNSQTRKSRLRCDPALVGNSTSNIYMGY